MKSKVIHINSGLSGESKKNSHAGLAGYEAVQVAFIRIVQNLQNKKKLPVLSGAAFLFIKLFCYWFGVMSLFRLSSLAGIGQI